MIQADSVSVLIWGEALKVCIQFSTDFVFDQGFKFFW